MTQYCHLDKRTTLETIPTPALVLDLDTLEANVEAMERLVGPTGKRIRPHVKTHRTTEIARHQIGGHAWGVTCATVGEVEAMAAAGIDDLLLANEVVDADKLERLALVAKNASVTLAVDDAEAVAAMSQFATRVGVTIGVLIDVDIHLHRCGVSSAADAVRLASIIEGSAGLRLMGIMGYEGRLRSKVERRAEKIASAYAILSEVRDAMQRKGFDVGIVSAGGTSTLVEALADGAGPVRHVAAVQLRCRLARHGNQQASWSCRGERRPPFGWHGVRTSRSQGLRGAGDPGERRAHHLRHAGHLARAGRTLGVHARPDTDDVQPA
jgi:D-serine deaminase-like pyridoxal phosphate-dependent protein